MYRIGLLNNTKAFRAGGLFHYTMSLIEGLKDYEESEVLIFYDDPTFKKFCFNSPQFRWIQIPENENTLSKITRGFSTLLGIRSPLLGRYRSLLSHKIDLLISFESLLGFHVNVPFLTFIGDIMYKYYPGLPEYTLKKRVIRDFMTKRLIKHAVFTVVDSQESKKDLLKFYKVKEEKIKPILLCAPPHLYKYRNLKESEIKEILDKYHIPKKFIFYPAQFWHHKNHLRLIQSLDLLRKKYNEVVPAVFVGAKWENSNNVARLIKELNISDQVLCLGYLSEREIVALYKIATALVFASFADYTNIPVLEAMVMGTPIICSNLFSMPEQVGNAGLFFDPFNVEDMAEKIYRIWTDEVLRKELATKGIKRAIALSPANFARQWKNLIVEASENRTK